MTTYQIKWRIDKVKYTDGPFRDLRYALALAGIVSPRVGAVTILREGGEPRFHPHSKGKFYPYHIVK